MFTRVFTVEHAINLLNRALEKDPDCISALFNYRVACNDALANDETIQCSGVNNILTLGFLGLINGLFGVDERGLGPITVVINSKTNKIIKFKKTD